MLVQREDCTEWVEGYEAEAGQGQYEGLYTPLEYRTRRTKRTQTGLYLQVPDRW